MPARRGLVFSYGDEFTASYVDAICSVLSLADVEVFLFETESCSYFDPERVRRYQGKLGFISDFGFHTLPSVNLEEYRSVCGDDIDFLRIRSLDLWRQGLPKDETVLDPENATERVLRGVALRIDAILLSVQADFVVIPHGGDSWTKILSSKARKHGIKCLYWESSFFPGRVMLDAKGPHFLPSASRMAIDTRDAKSKLDQLDLEQASAFLDDWIKERKSKHPQTEDDRQLADVDEFRKNSKGLIFIPMQHLIDASVFGGSIFYEDMIDFCRDVLRSCPDGWVVVCKIHPYATDRLNLTDLDIAKDHKMMFVWDVSIHDLLPRSDIVAVLTSNVGLEAAIHGRPVVVGGSPVYAGCGFTLERTESNSLNGLFADALHTKVDREAVVAFVASLLKHNLIALDDGQAARRVLDRALDLSADAAYERAPFAEFEPPRIKAYLAECTDLRAR